MGIKWTHAIVFFLIGVAAANRIGFLAPLTGSKSQGRLIRLLAGLNTPGSKSSEFLVAVLNVIAQIVLAAAGTISDGTATKFSLVGAVAYIISRGLSKYEQRPGPTPPPAG